MSTENQSERIVLVQNISMLQWLKPIMSFSFFLGLGLLLFFWYPKTSGFFHAFVFSTVNERVSGILRLPKMQEG